MRTNPETMLLATAAVALLMVPFAAAQQTGSWGALIFPPDGAVLTQSIPHFEWQRSEELNLDAVSDCEIQILADENAENVIDRDRIAGVIGWYVPDRELPPGNYTWRVAAVDAEGKPGTWSPKRKFVVRRPERVLQVPKGAGFQAIRQVIAEASKQTPAIVKFEPGDYRLDPGELRQFIELANVNDLEIDGGGATVVFTKPVELIQLEHCSRVQVKNFIFDFFNLTIRSSANECLGSFYANRHAILHVRLERTAGRSLSVNNGGNNHHNARTGPWLEGCLFENCGDDVCHVNGYAMAVASQPEPDRVRINYAQPYDQFGSRVKLDFRAGDRIQFYDAEQGRLVAERRVVEAVHEEKTVLVRLDHPVNGLTPGKLMPSKKADYEIIGFPGSAILLNDVENAVLRDNQIQAPPSKSESIVLSNTAKVQQMGNSILRLPAAQPVSPEKGSPPPTVAPGTKP